MSTTRIYLASLDDTFNVPADQLGNAPSGAGGLPAWAATTAYTAGQQRSNSAQLYVALVNHTSGSSFATDLAAGKWALMGAESTSVDGGSS